MNSLPLVSIVVPSYNHSEYIEKCIKSIIEQDSDNYELIVIDDGSSDSSPQVLKALKDKYDFTLILNKNQGLARTLNQGFKDIAKGKYLTFCASDDYWLPGKLSKQVSFMESHPEYAMVYGKTLIVDSRGATLQSETDQVNKGLRGGNIFKELLLKKFHPPVNYLFREKIIRDLGYYREHIWAEDFDMNVRIANIHKIGFINDYLSAYRKSEINKNLTFKTIYSHLDSINLFKDNIYYKSAIKEWHYRCFLWYSPYVRGKRISFNGMIHNLDRIFTLEFLIFFYSLIFKWKIK